MQVAPEYRANALAGLSARRRADRRAFHRQRRPPNNPGSRLTSSPSCPAPSVLDLDETVLDNTVYQARLMRDHAAYNATSWGEWVGAGEADAIPGAREFIARARSLGHTIFYISNRDCTAPPPTAADPCPAKTATMKTWWRSASMPRPIRRHLCCRGEKPEWNKSSKTSRRAFIARQLPHRRAGGRRSR